jgi:hypothetical protein
MATSPSDHNNPNIITWLDRLQQSVRAAGPKAGPTAFKLDSRPENIDSDNDSDSHDRVHPAAAADAPADSDDLQAAQEDAQNLPDAAVPLGLIANLSLSSNKKHSPKRQKKDPVEDAVSSDNLDDDNVVRARARVCSISLLTLVPQGVANETYFMPGPATDLGIRATLIEQHSPPEILVHGLVTPEDVDKLFDMCVFSRTCFSCSWFGGLALTLMAA